MPLSPVFRGKADARSADTLPAQKDPKAIRSVSIRYTGYLPDFDLDAFDYLKVGDFGDVACRNGDYPLTFAAIRERISQIEDADALPITFGGDHGIAYPIISEIAKRHPKRVGVLHIDAHLDNYSTFGDDEYSRCSPFYQLYNDPNMDSTKIVHIGIRGPRNHKEEFAKCKKIRCNCDSRKRDQRERLERNPIRKSN